MRDPDDRSPDTDTSSIPEPGREPEPSFDEPAGPAPAVEDAPGRSSEF